MGTDADPTVGVVIPSSRSQRYVAMAIESVLAQSRHTWQIAVVDDGSRENDAVIADSYARRDSRIRVLRQANRGMSAARNAGAQAVQTCEFLLFLDADDVL